MDLQQQEGFTSSAFAVAFSNDGKMLAAGNYEGTMRLWDVESGQLRGSFKGHTDAIHSLAFSPDDKTLLSGSADRTARLWDAVTGQELLTLKGHRSPVTRVAFAPDGKRLATAGGPELKLWLAAADPEATAFRSELEADDPDGPRATNNWGDRLRDVNRHQEAEDAYRKARARLEKLAAAFPDTADYRAELAYSLLAPSLVTDPPSAASESHGQVPGGLADRPCGPAGQIPRHVVRARREYSSDQRLDRSIPLLEAAVRLNRANRPADARTCLYIANLAMNYQYAGRLREATRLLEEAVELVRQQFGAADPQMAGPLALLGFNLLRQEKFADAESLLRELPGPSGRGGAGGVDNLQHPVDAGRLPGGPKEVRRGRAPVAARLRGDETARGPNAATRQATLARGRRAAGTALRRLGQTGPGGEVANRVGRPRASRGRTREANGEVRARLRRDRFDEL